MFNPLDLDATSLLVWGIVIHFISDFLFQSEWMAINKMKRRDRYKTVDGQRQLQPSRWWDRHLAAYVHSGIHTIAFIPLFGFGALFIGITHMIIDCRWVVVKWSQLVGQTQPGGDGYDMGTEVRIWTDQVFHIAIVAIAALLFTALS